nr:permease [Spirochaetota bacterium]
FIFRHEEIAKVKAAMYMPEPEVSRPLWKDIIYFGSMVAILVFANWGKSADTSGFWYIMFAYKWWFTSAAAVIFAAVIVLWYGVKPWKMAIAVIPAVILGFMFPHEPVIPFAAGTIGLSVITSTDKGEPGEWFGSTWGFAKQITPLLLGGVLVSGFLLGRPGHEGIIPAVWVSDLVGGNSFGANFFSSIVGAFMYFATLTEVPIVQGLIGSGMGKGPALALLLAGPALSLPNMLVINSYIGPKKTFVFCTLVIIMATVSGMIFGMFF